MQYVISNELDECVESGTDPLGPILFREFPTAYALSVYVE
jgi:hypothetical protein